MKTKKNPRWFSVSCPTDPENFTKICACVFCNVVGWHYPIATITLPLNEINPLSRYWTVTTHLLSIGRADWQKLHYMFNARDAKSWQRELPVGFQVRNCALNLLFINIFHDVVARIKADAWLKQNMSCWSVTSFHFSRKFERINRPTRHVLLQNTSKISKAHCIMSGYAEHFMEIRSYILFIMLLTDKQTNSGGHTTFATGEGKIVVYCCP